MPGRLDVSIVFMFFDSFGTLKYPIMGREDT